MNAPGGTELLNPEVVVFGASQVSEAGVKQLTPLMSQVKAVPTGPLDGVITSTGLLCASARGTTANDSPMAIRPATVTTAANPAASPRRLIRVASSHARHTVRDLPT